MSIASRDSFRAAPTSAIRCVATAFAPNARLAVIDGIGGGIGVRIVERLHRDGLDSPVHHGVCLPVAGGGSRFVPKRKETV